MSEQPTLPFQVYPSQRAKEIGWDEPDVFSWPGKAIHTGTTSTGKVVTQFLLRQKKDGFVKLKTWQSEMLVPFIPEDAPAYADPDFDTAPKQVESLAPKPLTSCVAGKDGECYNKLCPQLRDNEPEATGRHCPLDHGEDDY
jgi:hypothetical protein